MSWLAAGAKRTAVMAYPWSCSGEACGFPGRHFAACSMSAMLGTAHMPPASDYPPIDCRVLVLTGPARALRRRLGPTAWTVLEELLLDAAVSESMVVETHVRRVAEGVGISKDSAARALRRLIAEGIVSRHSSRDVRTGGFGRSVYALHLAGTVGVVVAERANETIDTSARPPRRHRRQRSDELAQGSLFDTPAGAAP